MSNITFKRFPGSNFVMALDLDKPDAEPRFLEGRERQRAFDMTTAQETRMTLRRCRDGCGTYFTGHPEATLCFDCEQEMRNASGFTAHDLGICPESCNECWLAAAGQRGEDF